MVTTATFDKLHLQARQNRWLRYFTVFCRVGLAIGFLPSGFVKIMGERFTALSNNHPMGHYLEALHHTGYYYTFIGIMQVTAAILLLIPRTATLGALLYFPLILNICLLSLAVRFEGSLVSSPLMVLANLYLLCWDYHKIKYILPIYRDAQLLPKDLPVNKKFPFLFFAGGFAFVILLVLFLINIFSIAPRNTAGDCNMQCTGSKKAIACAEFCDCIHKSGNPLDSCLKKYREAPEDAARIK